MQSRLALALILSFLVLVFLRPDSKPPTETDEPGSTPVEATGGAGTTPTPDDPPTEVTQAEAWTETLRIGPYQASFDNLGAVLTSLKLDSYFTELGLDDAAKADPTYWVPLVNKVESDTGPLSSLALKLSHSSSTWFGVDPSTARWEATVLKDDAGAEEGVRFTLAGNAGVTLEKTIRLGEGEYDLIVDLAVRNVSAEGLVGRSGTMTITPAVGVPESANDSFYVEPKAAVCQEDGGSYDLTREERHFSEQDGDTFAVDDIVWAGVDNKYFAVLLRAGEGLSATAMKEARWRTVWDREWAAENQEDKEDSYRHIVTDVDLLAQVPGVGNESRYSFKLYAGPKDRGVLLDQKGDGEALGELVIDDLGFFDGIAKLLLLILGFFQGLVGNWGFAIILLTLFVRLILFPFNRRSQTAMSRHATKMKRIQPKLNALKEKYEKDPRKQREEQARIMQEEGAFPPLGGCLPIFLQIPVFFGLFSALRVSFDLRQAPFIGYIKDLSEPDRFMQINLNLGLFEVTYLNILPPLMVVLWILQQRVMPKPTDPQALRMQKMMMWMPILFGFFLYNYAAGLSLYMITTSVFGILEQTVIKKIWPLDDTEQPKKKGGFMDRLAKLQEEAQRLEKMKREAKGQQQGQKQKRKKKGK